MNLWLRECPSDNTRVQYWAEYERFMHWYGGSLAVLTREHLFDYMQHIVDTRNLCARSVRTVMYTIMSLLSLGHRTGLLAVNVGAKLPLPKPRDTLNERILSRSEVGRIIAASDHKLMLRLIYYSGIRRAELVGLKWAHIQGAYGRGQITVYGKGQKTRTVGIPASVYLDLEAVRGEDEAPVFARPDGKPGHMSPWQAHRIYKRAAVNAGLPKASLHWFRHSYGTHALEAGAMPPLVQRDMGHSNLATTGRYLHARPKDTCCDYLEDV